MYSPVRKKLRDPRIRTRLLATAPRAPWCTAHLVGCAPDRPPVAQCSRCRNGRVPELFCTQPGGTNTRILQSRLHNSPERAFRRVCRCKAVDHDPIRNKLAGNTC